MIKINNSEDCCGCQACYNICPAKAISMKPDKEGFLYPEIDQKKCVNCHLCEKVCPLLTNRLTRDEIQKCFAGYAKNETIITHSSSGGVFPLLAAFILRSGGSVFGATIGEDGVVKHISINSTGHVEQLQGSKYVQSDVGLSYSLAKDLLKQGKKVLFTGTPCQIAGLKYFLGQEYDGLYTQDIICHGVPSPEAFRCYLAEKENQFNSHITHVNFRNKDTGWERYSMFLEFANGKKYYKRGGQDCFIQAFLSNLCLRPSCYECHFKSTHRLSDLTIADYWGADKLCSNQYNQTGTSLIVAHTEKGLQLLKNIENDIFIYPTNLFDALKYNPSAISSAPKNRKRNRFFALMKRENFSKAVQQCIRKKYIRKFLSKIYRCLRNAFHR